MVRDQALAVSGLLSRKMYGPPVKPPQPSLGLSAAFGGGIDWQTSARRGPLPPRPLHRPGGASNPYPSMATFDAPNREVCTIRRVADEHAAAGPGHAERSGLRRGGPGAGRRMVAGGGTTPDGRRSGSASASAWPARRATRSCSGSSSCTTTPARSFAKNQEDASSWRPSRSARLPTGADVGRPGRLDGRGQRAAESRRNADEAVNRLDTGGIDR